MLFFLVIPRLLQFFQGFPSTSVLKKKNTHQVSLLQQNKMEKRSLIKLSVQYVYGLTNTLDILHSYDPKSEKA